MGGEQVGKQNLRHDIEKTTSRYQQEVDTPGTCHNKRQPENFKTLNPKTTNLQF